MVDTTSNHYDYIIVGAGVAGLQLTLSLLSDSFFLDKRILILDSDRKDSNDKTFSFWEQGCGKWDNIVCKKWDYARCVSPDNKEIRFPLGDYQYKSIRSVDFYQYVIEQIKDSNQIELVYEEVLDVRQESNTIAIITNQSHYKANRVFDSRIEVPLDEIKDKSTYVNQSFLGYELTFSDKVFEENTFTMMDYSHQWEGSTSFMYILPFSKQKALVEYTFFAPFTPGKVVFENQLLSYLEKNYQGISYRIEAVEYGEIPMTNYNFNSKVCPNLIKIGTAAGWVKPSSGYAFKSIESNIEKLIASLKTNSPRIGKAKRFQFYDRLLLSILKHENEIGGKLFFEMYKRLNINLLFRFLDEQTTFIEEIKLIFKLPYRPFLRALFRKK